MVKHESPTRTPVAAANQILRPRPMGFPKSRLIESAASRTRIAQMWDEVRPRHLLHGRLRVAGVEITDDNRHVTNLAPTRQQTHLATLDLAALTVDIPVLHCDGYSLGAAH